MPAAFANSRLLRVDSFPVEDAGRTLDHGRDVGFVLQHAFNNATDDAIREASRQQIRSLKGPLILRIWPPGARSRGRGAVLRTLAGHTNEIHAVAITPDGRRAISGAWHDSARVWDLETGRCLRKMEVSDHFFWGLATTADGCIALSIGSHDRRLILWDIESGKLMRMITGNSQFNCVAMTVDGSVAVTGDHDGWIQTWDLSNGRQIHEWEGHGAYVYSARILATGSCLVTVSGDQTVRSWDFAGRLLRESRIPHPHAAVSADGHFALCFGLGTPVLFDLESDAEVAQLKGLSYESLRSADLTPDASIALTSSFDKTLKVWTLPRGISRGTLEVEENSPEVKLIADGKEAVSWSGRALKVLNLEGFEDIQVDDASLDHAVFKSDGSTSICSYKSPGQLKFQEPARCELWDLFSLKCVDAHFPRRGVPRAITRSNSVLVSIETGPPSHETHEIEIWDIVLKTCIGRLQGRPGRLKQILLCPDGGLAVGAFDELFNGVLVVWKIDTGTQLRTIQVGTGGFISSTALSPDGKRAVTGYHEDYGKHRQIGVIYDKIQVWDLLSGEAGPSIECTDYIPSIVVSMDGKRVIAAGWDSTVKVWSIESGECLQSLRHQDKVESVILLSENRVLSFDGDWRIWNMENGVCECSATFNDGASPAIYARNKIVGLTDHGLQIFEVHCGAAGTGSLQEDGHADVDEKRSSLSGPITMNSTEATANPYYVEHQGPEQVQPAEYLINPAEHISLTRNTGRPTDVQNKNTGSSKTSGISPPANATGLSSFEKRLLALVGLAVLVWLLLKLLSMV